MFQHTLKSHGITSTLRTEKGTDINAACGQLRLQTERRLSTDSTDSNRSVKSV
jgi:adenine C2-methylase RlmN of 23S rRNA A2503 and tRNA A37